MAATRLLSNTLKKLQQEPVEGFTVQIEDDANLFDWKVYLEGPSDTLYEGGVFALTMKFPSDFPMSPPELTFVSEFWHPNVYKDSGAVCISILHPPGEDEMSGELPGERWLPTQSVSTILLSVISLLSSPNFSSPANIDASVEWRKNPDAYKKRIQRLVQKANAEKPASIVIPHPDTNPEERAKQVEKFKELNKAIDMDEFMNDDNFYPNQMDDNDNEDSVSDEDISEEPESEEKEKKPVAEGKSKLGGKKVASKSNAINTKKDSKRSSSTKKMKVKKSSSLNNNNYEGQQSIGKKNKKCSIM